MQLGFLDGFILEPMRNIAIFIKKNLGHSDSVKGSIVERKEARVHGYTINI